MNQWIFMLCIANEQPHTLIMTRPLAFGQLTAFFFTQSITYRLPIQSQTQSNTSSNLFLGGLWINGYLCYVLRTNTTCADHDKTTYIWPIDCIFPHPIACHLLVHLLIQLPIQLQTQSNTSSNLFLGGLWINGYFCYVLRTNTTCADHDKTTYIWPIDCIFSYPINYISLAHSIAHPITNPI
jgi:hypothetical protein